MAAASTDYFIKVVANFSTTIGSGGVTDGTTTTIPLASVTNLPTDTATELVINRLDPTTEEPTNNYETVRGVISGTNLTSVVRGVEGTAQAWAAGKTVELLATGDIQNRMVTGILVEHNQDGTHASTIVKTTATQTLTNKTLTTPTIGSFTNSTHTHADAAGGGTLNASAIAAGTMATTRLGSGTADATTYLRGDQTWASASASTDGWTTASDTWAYASATTFTIAGVDRTTLFTKGTKIKLTQTTAKYFYVVSSSFSTNTTVTITAGSDYSLANAAITSPYYSYQVNPQGFPDYFTLTTPTWTASGTGFTNQPQNNAHKFKIDGLTCIVEILASTHATSGATGTFIATYTTGQLPSSTVSGTGTALSLAGTPVTGACYTDGTVNAVKIVKYDGTAIVGNSTFFQGTTLFRY